MRIGEVRVSSLAAAARGIRALVSAMASFTRSHRCRSTKVGAVSGVPESSSGRVFSMPVAWILIVAGHQIPDRATFRQTAYRGARGDATDRGRALSEHEPKTAVRGNDADTRNRRDAFAGRSLGKPRGVGVRVDMSRAGGISGVGPSSAEWFSDAPRQRLGPFPRLEARDPFAAARHDRYGAAVRPTASRQRVGPEPFMGVARFLP
jgi:hypothetical protein